MTNRNWGNLKKHTVLYLSMQLGSVEQQTVGPGGEVRLSPSEIRILAKISGEKKEKRGIQFSQKKDGEKAEVP